MKSVTRTEDGESAHPMTLRIQLLGAFRVTVGERVVGDDAWRRLRKAGALIKLLALAGGNRLHKEQLLEALWPELAPEAADNNLRRTLHHARRSLEPQGKGSHYLIWQGELLQLHSPAGLSIDVVQFEQAVEAARGSSVINDYRSALERYGGELLPEDRYEDWAIPRRESLHRLYISLWLELARLYELHEARDEAVAAYRRVSSIDPLHEAASAALMRLYALAGQRGQALQEYQRLAAALDADLGVMPDAATQRLSDEIRSGQFPGPEAAAGLAAARAPTTLRTNLPYALTSFVGREVEMGEVQQALAKSRLLTLTGPGGTGKTRLALEVGRQLLEQYGDGVWLVELAALSDSQLVAETVIKALALKEQPGSAAGDQLAQYLAPRHLLLILDNCEHLSEAVAILTSALLRNAPRLSILATSRQSLEIMGEAVRNVPPLTLPHETWSLETGGSPGAALEFEAIQLFVERAQLVEATFALTQSNFTTVVELCRRLDGLPLAIELAAARLNTMTLTAISAGLDDRFALLTRGNRTALPRHQTLRAVIDWSYDLLDEAEQKIFRRLAVFAGGASLEAVESVCNREGDLALGARHGVMALSEKHLLSLGEGSGGEQRITMLETVHTYAREKLTAAAEQETLSRAHAHYYLRLAEAARDELSGPHQALWLEQLDTEHDNLRAALRWTEARKDIESGQRLVAALWRFWLTRSYFGEGRDWCARVLRQVQPGDDSTLVVTVLKGAGALSYRQADYAQARTLFEAALSMARRIDDRQQVAALLSNLGLVAQIEGSYERARDLYTQSLEMTRALGDRVGAARTLNNLGLAATFQGEYAAARSLLSEALSTARDVGNKMTEDNALNDLGVLAIYEEAYAEARALYEERLALARELGNKMGVASALHNLGYVASCTGDDATAEALYQESLELAAEIGDRGTTASALHNLAGVAARRGDYDRARDLYRQSLEIACEIGARYLTARILEQMALLEVMSGASLQAARLGGAAEVLREAMHAPQPPAERAEFRREIGAARATVDAQTWQTAWQQGRLLSPEEVLAELA